MREEERRGGILMEGSGREGRGEESYMFGSKYLDDHQINNL
jgi:hypothetical protein